MWCCVHTDYKCFCKTVKSRVRTATYQANIYAHKTGRFSAINQGTLICSIIYNAFLIDLQLPKADLNRPHCQYQGTLKIDALLRHYTALLRYSNDNSVRYSPFVYLASPFSMSAATQSTKSTTSIQTIIATYSPREPHWRPCSLHAAALVNEAGLQEDDRHIPIVALSRQSRAAWWFSNGPRHRAWCGYWLGLPPRLKTQHPLMTLACIFGAQLKAIIWTD